jgi:beta-ribofuranosylaminobenzene 5'-phosphate synthase
MAREAVHPSVARAVKPDAVHATAPARLHLGFLDMHGGLGRRFGSIGLSLENPVTELSVTRAKSFSASGAETERVEKLLRRFADELHLSGAYSAHVESAIPAHAGLGSGTQLALSVGRALSVLEGVDVASKKLGESVERGARSAIGMAAFAVGGFIVDAGRGAKDVAPPVIIRRDFPSDWRVILILDPKGQGAFGKAEKEAFAALPQFPESAAAAICHRVLMQLVPGLMEADIKAFGAALSEIQKIVGGHFAPAQGGSAWTNPAVGKIAKKLEDGGARGIGQSSWGPTGFAFTESAEIAARLYSTLVQEAKAQGLDLLITRGRNSGARVEAAPLI